MKKKQKKKTNCEELGKKHKFVVVKNEHTKMTICKECGKMLNYVVSDGERPRAAIGRFRKTDKLYKDFKSI